ncbi:MAG: YtxH domain-containing protein [Gemmatimonadetes bacterium]|nr:YtxH domain-containing protein [Gemmatimonadota bacterium]
MSDSDESPVVVVERGGLGQFFLGLAVGAGLALIFAPQTGEETRRELKNRGRRLRSATSEKMEDLQETLGGKYEETRAQIEQGIDTARQVARDTREVGADAVTSAREELERRLSDARAARHKEAATETADE